MKTLDEVRPGTPLTIGADDIRIDEPGVYYIAAIEASNGANSQRIQINSGSVRLNLSGMRLDDVLVEIHAPDHSGPIRVFNGGFRGNAGVSLDQPGVSVILDSLGFFECDESVRAILDESLLTVRNCVFEACNSGIEVNRGQIDFERLRFVRNVTGLKLMDAGADLAAPRLRNLAFVDCHSPMLIDGRADFVGGLFEDCVDDTNLEIINNPAKGGRYEKLVFRSFSGSGPQLAVWIENDLADPLRFLSLSAESGGSAFYFGGSAHLEDVAVSGYTSLLGDSAGDLVLTRGQIEVLEVGGSGRRDCVFNEVAFREVQGLSGVVGNVFRRCSFRNAVFPLIFPNEVLLDGCTVVDATHALVFGQGIVVRQSELNALALLFGNSASVESSLLRVHHLQDGGDVSFSGLADLSDTQIDAGEIVFEGTAVLERIAFDCDSIRFSGQENRLRAGRIAARNGFEAYVDEAVFTGLELSVEDADASFGSFARLNRCDIDAPVVNLEGGTVAIDTVFALGDILSGGQEMSFDNCQFLPESAQDGNIVVSVGDECTFTRCHFRNVGVEANSGLTLADSKLTAHPASQTQVAVLAFEDGANICGNFISGYDQAIRAGETALVSGNHIRATVIGIDVGDDSVATDNRLLVEDGIAVRADSGSVVVSNVARGSYQLSEIEETGTAGPVVSGSLGAGPWNNLTDRTP